MGSCSCITKPTYVEKPSPDQAPSRVEEQAEPYRVPVVEGARQLSASWEDSGDYSLDSELRDSVDILREAVRQKAALAKIEEQAGSLRSTPVLEF